jgi:hypothetical protein
MNTKTQTALRSFLALAAITFAMPSQAVVVLNFEGINATYPSGFAFINNFYNGGTSSDGTSGANYGISFTDNAQAICLNTPGVFCSNTSRGGLGDPNSQRGGLFFLSGSQTFMNMPAGFDTGFSLFYSAINTPGSLSVYDGLDGTGNLLATLNLPTTPISCDLGTYGAGFCPFVPVGVSFSGTAKSISFAGAANQIVFDDVTFGSATPGQVAEPASVLLLSSGLGVLAAFRRKAR